MDLRQLKNIMKEFEESSIHKLEIIEKDFTVKMEKKSQDSYSPISTQVDYNEKKITNEKIIEKKYVPVVAPLVGIFYDSLSPDSDSFVKENQHVNKGDVLFIVEAMKVMNEIVSPITGIVRKINVENATMVEYGQVIMEIEE